ncbi:MAG: hypothetical protein OEL53_11925 [Rhodospirillales bacterium]|nr:hypothetical protein [Rhodospirillales bacterium]
MPLKPSPVVSPPMAGMSAARDGIAENRKTGSPAALWFRESLSDSDDGT